MVYIWDIFRHLSPTFFWYTAKTKGREESAAHHGLKDWAKLQDQLCEVITRGTERGPVRVVLLANAVTLRYGKRKPSVIQTVRGCHTFSSRTTQGTML